MNMAVKEETRGRPRKPMKAIYAPPRGVGSRSDQNLMTPKQREQRAKKLRRLFNMKWEMLDEPAEMLGITRQALTKWLVHGVVPATRVADVVKMLDAAVTPEYLRPDVFRTR